MTTSLRPCSFYTPKKDKGGSDDNFYRWDIENKGSDSVICEIIWLTISRLQIYVNFDNIEGLGGFLGDQTDLISMTRASNSSLGMEDLFFIRVL
jgi:hypothetical protein